MLEIVFDENKQVEFGDDNCFELREEAFTQKIEWQMLLSYAENIVGKYGQYRVLKINYAYEAKVRNYLALALQTANYEEKYNLETIVFKVKNCREAMEQFKPFAALSNALRYVRDLSRMPREEAWADIKRLGYLGLKIDEDYIEKQIKIKMTEQAEVQKLEAENFEQVLIGIGLIKFAAIAKVRNGYYITMKYENFIKHDFNENNIINQIIKLARL